VVWAVTARCAVWPVGPTASTVALLAYVDRFSGECADAAAASGAATTVARAVRGNVRGNVKYAIVLAEAPLRFGGSTFRFGGST